MGFSKIAHLFLIFGCSLFLINIVSCSGTDNTTTTVKTKKSKVFKAFQPQTDLSSVPAKKATETNSNNYRYWSIYDKISAGAFDEAAKELIQFTKTCYYPQRYGLEALILKLCLLASLRQGYLALGTAYQEGWKKTITADKSLPKEERIIRLTNLSQNYLAYYRQHKETTIALVSAYNDLMEIYQELSPEQLCFAGQPLRKQAIIENPYLAEIEQGAWLETNLRQKVENIEFNNSFLTFLSALLGTKNIQETNTLLKRENIILDKYGFLFWLSQSFTTPTSSPDAFTDEPNLAKILEYKSTECRKLLEQIMVKEKGKKAPLDRFNPLALMK